MPATKQKALAGLNPAHENNTRAFTMVKSILDSLKKVPALFNLVSVEEVKILEEALGSSKNVYVNS